MNIVIVVVIGELMYTCNKSQTKVTYFLNGIILWHNLIFIAIYVVHREMVVFSFPSRLL